VGHDRGVLDERFDAARDSAQVQDAAALQEGRARSRPPSRTKVIMPPKPSSACGRGRVAGGWQAGVDHALDLAAALEPLGDARGRLSSWRCMRRCSVFAPRSTRKLSIGRAPRRSRSAGTQPLAQAAVLHDDGAADDVASGRSGTSSSSARPGRRPARAAAGSTAS
jgi:hypothetical protein